ncbi:MAG: ParA family partition ATPase [Gammaproteobacteria bacterium]
MIIGVLNQKGGVGKTTLSLSIAHELARQTSVEEVLVVDADPQQSSLNWSEVREGKLPFTVIGFSKKSLHRDLPQLAKNYTHIIIDGPPRVTELARSCIMASDVVLIPCTPSPYDVWASSETVELIKEASVYKEKLKGVFTINRKITNTAIGRDVVDSLNEMQLPVLSSHISQRVIFAESAALGRTVFDVDPEGKAASEITALVNELLKLGENL